MRRRRLIVLLIALLAVMGAGAFAVLAANSTHGSPEKTAESYFTAWRRGDVQAMSRLVFQVPDDFMARHLSLSSSLRVDAIELTPGTLTMTGEESAEVPFTGRRKLRELGWWEFQGTLRLAVREKGWHVLWAPETLHPLLKDNGILELASVQAPSVELVTSEGERFPENSYAEYYLEKLADAYPHKKGTALQAILPDDSTQTLISKVSKPKAQKTTLSRAVQAAAARALDGVSDAAIVAIRSSTGEIVGVADRLEGGNKAFTSLFPPGSTFKTVVAAALMGTGLSGSSQVECPATYQIPGFRSFRNAAAADRGTISFTEAFAHSCNTTFVEEATTRMEPGDLIEAAAPWGFRGLRLPTGAGGSCGQIPEPEKMNLDWFGEAVIGQASVQATPLCMAAVAAAVESGVWRSPRLLPADEAADLEGPPLRDIELDAGVAEGLREMMRAVVEYGTAAGAGLPEGVAGKTGTAEVDTENEHGWFIGYRDDLAFCVFVRNGGSGRSAAVPIAARFLQGL
ncbi:penicillin-binding transpeptidase domain-containing protein [Nonomuraea sp. NPDC059007]|uniref:penicillin-binding transpeptidase domain-containing protein n=1 Tax=Nonomuraea sp. NPDC059007 TaxID=3346692 RepID=UPI0036A1012A